MKRIISFLLILALCVTFLASCSLLPEAIGFRQVNFYVDGELYETSNVMVGQSVANPKNPEKENFVFVGWRTEGSPAYMYDFSSIVMTDLNLHAHFALDTVEVGNMIASQTLKSTVQVINLATNTIGDKISGSSLAQGSGVVIKISGGCCYVLTNAHVIKEIEGYSNHQISVRDPWGYVYEAEVYVNQSTGRKAVSQDYDLAVIRFIYAPQSDQKMTKITFGDDPEIGDYVVALGNPKGLINSVTYGMAVTYQQINAPDDDPIKKVTFDVLYHNAPTNHGSSGGALVDVYGNLVGLHFAGVEGGPYSCAIPVSQVRNFLNLYYPQYK